MKRDKSGQGSQNFSARLVITLPGESPETYLLTDTTFTIGREAGNSIEIANPSVSGRHAELEIKGEVGRLIDLDSSNGTRVNGIQITDINIQPGDHIQFGVVEALFLTGHLSLRKRLLLLQARIKKKVSKGRFLALSLFLHIGAILLLAKLVLFSPPPAQQDFSSSETSFVSETKGPSEPEGAESGSLASAVEFKPEPVMSASVDTSKLVQALTVTTTSTHSLAVGSRQPSMSASNAINKSLGGIGTAGTGLGKGFGSGSGLGKGLGDWIGSGGIGISGRGKTLKTGNEFYCYFVIHSGDWYAALDWRGAPQKRQTELSSPGHPDEANISWYKTTPMPGIGPFITYRDCYGFMPRPNREGEIDDNRGGCVEFTPGAMSNLLRFIRVASNNNIKGGSKPKAVVLDRKLVPYTYEKITNQLTWNPESRENLRQTLRKALPVGGRFGDTHGYIWNPQPADKQQDDFLIEYLLDVKPMPPFVYLTGNDDFTMNDAEIETLNEYVRRGGAIWGDCGFAGNRSKFDVAFRREMKRVIPDIDKPFKILPPNSTLFVRGEDAYFDLPKLPPGMQHYEAPVQIIEITPGVISVVLTKNAYGNFLRFDMTMVNNQFQMGGELGRGRWVNNMWEYREEFFRGMSDETVMNSYSLGSNILVYMLGRWPSVLNRLENR